MINTNYLKIIYKLFQQANSNRYLYINILLYICCLISPRIFTQDSTYKKFYYPSGVLSSEGFFLNNSPAGKWTNYYANGNIKSVGYWKEAKLDSTWTFFDIKGNKVLEENYKKNYKNGKIIKYGKLQYKEQEVNFVNGNRVGEELLFYNGTETIREKNNYIKDKKHGISYQYDKNEVIITITKYNMGLIEEKEEINRKDREGKKHGKWKEFFDNGKIKKEETYFHGVIEGLIKSFNKDGGLKDIEIYKDGIEEEKKMNLKVNRSEIVDSMGNVLIGVVYDGKKQGLFKVINQKKEIINYKYFNNDTLIKQGMYDTLQRKVGQWFYYHKNEKIKKTGFYKQGKMDSIWYYYYKNGNLQQKGNYNNDLPKGKWVWWYKNEKIKREEYYLKGKENGVVVELDSLGKILTKGQYSFGLREGDWFYVINDIKEEGKYIGGMKTGIWKTTYLSTDKTKFIGEFLNDIPLGEHKEFHANGKVKQIGKYKDGEKNGEWKKYNYDGELQVTFLYKRGIEIKRDGFKIK